MGEPVKDDLSRMAFFLSCNWIGVSASMLTCLICLGCYGQAKPDALVEPLGVRNERESIGLFTCSSDSVSTAAQTMRRLIETGRDALPGIERALADLELKHEQSIYSARASWLLKAYATLSPDTAVARIKRMIDDPNLSFLRPALDEGVAVAFRLDSYVSGNRRPVKEIHCGPVTPRQTLDQFIVGWFSADPSLMDGALTERAQRSVKAPARLIRRPDEILHDRDSRIAVGYKLIDNPLADPANGVLPNTSARQDLVWRPAEMQLKVAFVNQRGEPCIERRVSSTQLHESQPFLIDDPLIADLILAVALCSVSTV